MSAVTDPHLNSFSLLSKFFDLLVQTICDPSFDRSCITRRSVAEICSHLGEERRRYLDEKAANAFLASGGGITGGPGQLQSETATIPDIVLELTFDLLKEIAASALAEDERSFFSLLSIFSFQRCSINSFFRSHASRWS